MSGRHSELNFSMNMPSVSAEGICVFRGPLRPPSVWLAQRFFFEGGRVGHQSIDASYTIRSFGWG